MMSSKDAVVGIWGGTYVEVTKSLFTCQYAARFTGAGKHLFSPPQIRIESEDAGPPGHHCKVLDGGDVQHLENVEQQFVWDFDQVDRLSLVLGRKDELGGRGKGGNEGADRMGGRGRDMDRLWPGLGLSRDDGGNGESGEGLGRRAVAIGAVDIGVETERSSVEVECSIEFAALFTLDWENECVSSAASRLTCFGVDVDGRAANRLGLSRSRRVVRALADLLSPLFPESLELVGHGGDDDVSRG
jgi:hypothetical protein